MNLLKACELAPNLRRLHFIYTAYMFGFGDDTDTRFKPDDLKWLRKEVRDVVKTCLGSWRRSVCARSDGDRRLVARIIGDLT